MEYYFSSSSKQLFSFAHSLIPDDLQAQQLVIDAVSAVCSLLGEKGIQANPKEALCDVYRSIYQLAQRRFSQLTQSLIDQLDVPFFHLSVEQRAILFLRGRLNMTWEEIATILSRQKHEVVASYRHQVQIRTV